MNKNEKNILKNALISYIRYKKFKKNAIQMEETVNLLMKSITPLNLNMFDMQKGIEIEYEKFCKIIQNKNLILKIENFLDLYYNFYQLHSEIAQKVSAKKFLFMWLIIGFPQFTISKTHQELTLQPKNIYPNEIYKICLELLNSLIKLNNAKSYSKTNIELLRKFTKSLNIYSNAITYFLERDKKEEIVKMAKEYYDINETIIKIKASNKYSEQMKVENEIFLNKTKEKILTQINKFDKSIKKEELESYSNMNLLKNLKIEELQFQIMLNDIKEKKMFYFKRSIEWIKESLINLKGLKTTNGVNLNEILDADLIIQKITMSLTFDNNNVENYGNYIMKILSELQSQNSLEESKNKWDDLKNKHKNLPMHLFLTNMIFFVIKEIQQIYEQLELIRTLIDLEINPF